MNFDRPANDGGGGVRWREPNATGARPGGVVGADEHRVSGYQFVQACGTTAEILLDPAEVVEGMMETGGQSQAVVLVCAERSLEMTEESARARKGEGHGPELAEKLVPFVDGEATLRARDGSEECGEALESTLGQGDGHRDGINNPAKDLFAGGPGCVAIEKFLDGDGLRAVDWIIGCQRAKHVVNGVQEDAADTPEAPAATLGGANKVVDKNIDELERPLVEEKGGWGVGHSSS
jgi:hypothetical protein